jgi:hypothetical protein
VADILVNEFGGVEVDSSQPHPDGNPGPEA